MGDGDDEARLPRPREANSMGLHDRLFKQLLQTFFGDLLRLVAPELAARLVPGAARFLDKETFPDWPRSERQEVDLLAEVPRADKPEEEILVHVEVEAQARADTAKRLFRYALQLQLRHGRPVLTILVNLRGGRPGVETLELTEDVGDLEVHRFRYLAFGLGACRAEDYLARPEPLAWALAALMRPPGLRRAEHKLACLRQIARAELTEAERFILLNCVETYRELGPEDERELAWLQSLEGNQEVAEMQLTWAEKMEARGEARGMEKGLERGLEQGLERGRREGETRILLGLLERRFGPLTAEARERVEGADADTLLRWGERLLTARRLEEVLQE
jgi:hypothetical protein